MPSLNHCCGFVIRISAHQCFFIGLLSDFHILLQQFKLIQIARDKECQNELSIIKFWVIGDHNYRNEDVVTHPQRYCKNSARYGLTLDDRGYFRCSDIDCRLWTLNSIKFFLLPHSSAESRARPPGRTDLFQKFNEE